MKKLILFLLLPLWMVAQTSNGQEQEFDYGIKNNSTQTITTPPYLTTTGVDGTQGKIPSALVEKTDNKQNSLAVDGTGSKYPTVDAVNSALPKTYTKVVYVNSTSPTTATIFDDVNPPVVNDDMLKADVANLYIGTDASTWVWNSSSYVTKVVPDGSNFWIYGTNIPAGSNKNEPIVRKGDIFSDGNITAGLSLRSDNVQTNAVNLAFETPNTIASFDAGKQLKSLPTDTYPSLTELSYAKGVTSGIQAQINGKADLDGSGKVLLSQINDALLGSVNYKGTYNATTNTPAIPTATSSNKGWYYIISTAGTQQGFNFVNGDWIISNGTSWGKVDNNNTVTSVNGQVGAVSVTASSIGAQTTLTNPITGTGVTNFLPKFNGTSSQTASRFFDDGTTASIASSFTLATDLKSSTANMVLSDANGAIFRGVRANSWTDAVSTRFFQIGNTSDNVAFTLQLGNTMSRLMFTSLKTQFSPIGTSIPPPIGIFEILYDSNNVGFSLSTSGQTVINKVPTTSAGTYDFLSRNTSTGVVEKITSASIAPIASPAFTDTPTAPTAAVGTNTTQIATTAFVSANSMNIPHLRFNNTDKTIWNNGKGGVASNLSYGEGALSALTTGTNSLAIGYQALVKATTGKVNLAFGNFTLNNLIDGSNNTGIGSSALGGIIDGNYNVALGGGAGRFYGSSGSNDNTSSTNSIFLGGSTRASSSTVDNEIVIGSNALGSGSNTATIGSSSIIKTVLRGVINYSTPYTVATLPAGTQGDTAFVTDALAPTYMTTVVGGGAFVTPVFYNGSAWVAH